MLNYIIWDVSPIILNVGKISLRWYSLLISTAFLIGFFIIQKIFEKEQVPEKAFNKFVLYLFLSTVIGLRLGHCLFYEPAYYLSHPFEILKVWEGGLASHGAAVGILLGIYLFSRKHNASYFWMLDRIIIIVCIIGAMVRIGNLMNSEIIGAPTNNESGFLFVNSVDKYITQKNKEVILESGFNQLGQDTVVDGMRYTKLQLYIDFKPQYNADYIVQNLKATFPALISERKSMEANLKMFSDPVIEVTRNKGYNRATMDIYAIPRYPTQLFESFFCVVLFFIYLTVYIKRRERLVTGMFFSTFLIALFLFRFFVEYFKKEQVDFESGMLFNMGQLLSLPFIIGGIVLLIVFLKRKEKRTFYKE